MSKMLEFHQSSAISWIWPFLYMGLPCTSAVVSAWSSDCFCCLILFTLALEVRLRSVENFLLRFHRFCKLGLVLLLLLILLLLSLLLCFSVMVLDLAELFFMAVFFPVDTLFNLCTDALIKNIDCEQICVLLSLLYFLRSTDRSMVRVTCGVHVQDRK